MRNVIYAINVTLTYTTQLTHFHRPYIITHHAHLAIIHFTVRVSHSSSRRGTPFTSVLTYICEYLTMRRKTHQLMVPYWPDNRKKPVRDKSDVDFAQAFVSKKKVVFSRSLASADDGNTRIVRTNLHDEILKLKREPGRDILVAGVDIPSQLTGLA